eukprot:gb/GECG01013904.1/.p1 GENE.gb/GECG01013904.1/~~gb/GECG01013904.1/.p1  ORF type:complete len:518 (+),score=82.80 gb/GECG01013904.1/:1-1554(+)
MICQAKFLDTCSSMELHVSRIKAVVKGDDMEGQHQQITSSSGRTATVRSHLNDNTLAGHTDASHDDKRHRSSGKYVQHPFKVARQQKVNFPDFDRAFQEETSDGTPRDIPPENLNLSIEEIAELRAETFSEEENEDNIDFSISYEGDKDDVNYFGNGKHSISTLKTPEGRGQTEQDKYVLLRSRGTPQRTEEGIAESWGGPQNTQRKLFGTPPKERKQVFLSPFSSLPQVFMSPQRVGESEVVYTDEGGELKENRTPGTRKKHLPPRSPMPYNQKSSGCDTNRITPSQEEDGECVLEDWAISPIGPSQAQGEYMQVPASERLSFGEEVTPQFERGRHSKSKSRLHGPRDSGEKADNVSVSLKFSDKVDEMEISQASEPVSTSSTISSITSTMSRLWTHSTDHDSTMMSVSILPSLDAIDFSASQDYTECKDTINTLSKMERQRTPGVFKSREEPRANCVSSTSNPVASPAWNTSLSGSSFSSDRSSPSKAYKLWKLRKDVEDVKLRYRSIINSPPKI